ncbi:MAG: hypothetical protein LRY76_04295 [Alphaproteobacteria bacterium]|nr:hypothetical protein [Alphaproteobacteria bacterium]MCD8570740.1 hypothetical protein [Alphaproteobacteria bacterium]
MAPRKSSSRSSRRRERRYWGAAMTFAGAAAAGYAAYSLHTDPAYHQHVAAIDTVRSCVARVPGAEATYPRDFMSYWMQSLATNFVISVQGKDGSQSPDAHNKLYGQIVIDFRKGTLSAYAEERGASEPPYWGDMSAAAIGTKEQQPSGSPLLKSKEALDEVAECHREALRSLMKLEPGGYNI